MWISWGASRCLGPTGESLTYLVWGVNIVKKTKLMVQGRAGRPKGPPPILSPYSPLRSKGLVQCWGHRWEGSEKLVWASMGPVVDPPKSYIWILTPRIGLIQKHDLCWCNSVTIHWPYWVRMGPSPIGMKCPYKKEGGLGSRHTGRMAEVQVRPMQLQPRNAEACQQPPEAKKRHGSVFPQVHHGERDPVNTWCGASASRAGREDIPVDWNHHSVVLCHGSPGT